MNKIKKLFGVLLLLLFGTTETNATTWDEPWADKVIKEADYFVLADIVSYDENGIRIKIIKQLGGQQLPVEIEIKNFYLLTLMSMSGGHGAEFSFDNISQSYFFIKRNLKDEYCISTPTSGFDIVRDNSVSATYRHSYHQASVPQNIYEMTMTAIYNHYHNLPYDNKKIADFINKTLVLKPAGFEEDEIKTFFLQHVALETIFHLRLNNYYSLILPFFKDDSNFHNRVSASRALVASGGQNVVDLLLEKIASNKDDDFTTVICIWTLKELKPKFIKKELQKLSKTASVGDNGFGGNIMDPRVSTRFPTVKTALDELIKSL